MGIRYYAYAFDSSMTEKAIADPSSVLSGDPFADAWGMEPGAQVGHATMEQRTPERDLLYLDKAWSLLQSLTEPAMDDIARPSFRIFEGQVTMVDYGWEPWIRVVTPDEIPDIAADLNKLCDDEIAPVCSVPPAGVRLRIRSPARTAMRGWRTMRSSTCGRHESLSRGWPPRTAGWST